MSQNGEYDFMTALDSISNSKLTVNDANANGKLLNGSDIYVSFSVCKNEPFNEKLLDYFINNSIY